MTRSSLRHLLISLTALFLFSLIPLRAAESAAPFASKVCYKTTWGTLRLQSHGHGNDLFGTYGSIGGTVQGTLSGHHLNGWWSEPESVASADPDVGLIQGPFQLFFNADWSAFSGTWSSIDGAHSEDDWSGTRIPCP